MMRKIDRMELLAPAGGMASALAAFDAGADAVYVGMKRFNARERTENLSLDDLSRLLEYASKLGRKVYVAFNTLIKESEIPDAAAMLAELDFLRPDAIIVQDIGILRVAREFFPNLALHASTQMAVHNSAGLRTAAEMGISRVILERQASLDEIRAMSEGSPVELEVFVHGALCCSLSGACLLSSWLGGWSGNRGKCKQPCRRRHFSKSGNGFFLSTMDLCALDILPELQGCGVASLKIEGRLRKPDYVSNAVSAYRLAIDSLGKNFEEALPEAKAMLARTCGRKWSPGFYTKESRESLIHHQGMGVSGLLCGRVDRISRTGFSVSLSKRIHVGDSIRMQPPSGDEGPALTITRMSIDGRQAMKASKGQTAFIHCDKPVPEGSLVYKIGESSDPMADRMASLPMRRIPLDVSISVSEGGISASLGSMSGAPEWRNDVEFQRASTSPLSAETLEREFAASASETFRLGKISCNVSGSPFIPASQLKSLRREFWTWVASTVKPESVKALSETRLASFMEAYNRMRGASPDAHDSCILLKGAKAPHEGMCVIRRIDESPEARDEVLLPFFVPEAGLKSLGRSIAALAKSGVEIFRVSSLHHFHLLKGLKAKAALPLPVCNSLAAAELLSLGATVAVAWIELEAAELELLAAKSPIPLESYRYGRPVLLATRASIPVEGEVSDARGNKFAVVKTPLLNIVLPERPMSVPGIKGMSGIFDYTHASPGEGSCASFNFKLPLA